MNTGYTIYQVERTKSAAEQREVDRSNAELAAAISRLWRALAAPWRALAAPWRPLAVAGTACGMAPSGLGHCSSRLRGNVPRNCVGRFRGNAGSRRDEEQARRLPGRTGRPGAVRTSGGGSPPVIRSRVAR